jgi:hypothetical protein
VYLCVWFVFSNREIVGGAGCCELGSGRVFAYFAPIIAVDAALQSDQRNLHVGGAIGLIFDAEFQESDGKREEILNVYILMNVHTDETTPRLPGMPANQSSPCLLMSSQG